MLLETHVPQTTMGVTFGAPLLQTPFRCLCTSWSDLVSIHAANAAQ